MSHCVTGRVPGTAVGSLVTALVAASMMLAATALPGRAAGSDTSSAETRFHTGCQPGPFTEPAYEAAGSPAVSLGPARAVSLDVAIDSAHARRPILGSGFNFEHALWSCPQFRHVLRSQLLEPFHPAYARLDTGLLPAAPADLTAAELGPEVYAAVLDSTPYADSWRFFHRLERADVQVLLGIWGGPAQFTDTGTRLGTLLPEHYDDYVEYVASVIDYLVQRQGIQVWATTIANEPDGGDGNRIPPPGLAYIAHQLAPRLAAYGVKLYGPDTSSAAAAMAYVPLLLDDPDVVANLAFVGFHQYYPTPDVATVAEYVALDRPSLPVIVTEYTSMRYGDLDAGEESSDQLGFTLDVAETLLAHYRYGADAAIYWDAVDYLQPGHDAITKWGLLGGPESGFAPRTRYFGLLQVLSYLQPGAKILGERQETEPGASVGTLALRTREGDLAIVAVNAGLTDVELQLQLTGDGAPRASVFDLTRTDRTHSAETLGEVYLHDARGMVFLPGRSITTLVDRHKTD